MNTKLKLPRLLYGPVSEVARRSRKAATQFYRGASLEEIAGSDWFTLDEVDGHILVGQPMPGNHYYCAFTFVDAVLYKTKQGATDPMLE